MADYSQEQVDAYNDIKDAGASIVVKQTTLGTYSVASDSYPNSTVATDSTYALIKQYNERFVDGTRIQVDDRQLLIPAYGLSITLSVGDIVIMNNQDWEIVNPNPLIPGGTIILYKAQVRRV